MKRFLFALAVAALLVWASLPVLASQENPRLPGLRTTTSGYPEK